MYIITLIPTQIAIFVVQHFNTLIDLIVNIYCLSLLVPQFEC